MQVIKPTSALLPGLTPPKSSSKYNIVRPIAAVYGLVVACINSQTYQEQSAVSSGSGDTK